MRNYFPPKTLAHNTKHLYPAILRVVKPGCPKSHILITATATLAPLQTTEAQGEDVGNTNHYP